MTNWLRGLRPRSFRRGVLTIWFGLVLGAFGLVACDADPKQAGFAFQGEVPVGVLHSLTGTMAISEDSAITGEFLAIEEINAAGGVMIGDRRMKLRPVLRDGESDPTVFAREAERLIDHDKTSVVFGGWTSSSRKAMLPVFERKDALLYYPIQYEGVEQAPNVLYFGATPNQQSEPVIDWMFDQGVNEFFLVGSDYVYPRTANQIMIRQIESRGGTILGELYLPLGDEISDAQLDLIEGALRDGGGLLNTVNGDSNESLFRGLSGRYLVRENGVLTVSFSIDEATVAQLGSRFFIGSYVSQGFFQCLETTAARQFVERFKARFGRNRPIGEPAATGYTMVHMWAKAVQQANSLSPDAVMAAMKTLSFESPSGTVRLLENQHLTKHVALGQIQLNGDITISTKFGEILPEPWIESLNRSGDNSFVAPSSTP